MMNILKKRWVMVSVVLVAVAAFGGYFYVRSSNGKPPESVAAVRGTLVQQVTVTGHVKSAQSVELAFEKGGKISRVNVKVGDKVTAGNTLVVMENSELAANLAKARASVQSAQAQLAQYKAARDSEKAKLDELNRGTRAETISVYQTKVDNARTAVEDAEKGILNAVQDAYTQSDDSVHNKIDQFFSNPTSASPRVVYLVIDPQLQNDLQNQRPVIEVTLNTWKDSVNKASSASGSDPVRWLSEAKEKLSSIKSFFEKSSAAVNSASANTNLSQTTLDAWRTNMSVARTGLNTVQSGLTAAEEKWRAAKSAMTLAQQDLALQQAHTPQEQITAQQAKIKQAEATIASQQAQVGQTFADVQAIEAQIGKTVIKAPISGVVTKQDAKVGEIVALNAPLVTLISGSEYEIESNIAEADIAKVKPGNIAKVTLDAYGADVMFDVKVVAVDPAATVVDGVQTYKVTFQFMTKDDRVKSGLTANIVISTEKRDNVVMVPQRAIITKNSEKFARILEGDPATEREVKIKTGLRSSDGNVEILEGLKEGDKVVTSVQ